MLDCPIPQPMAPEQQTKVEASGWPSVGSPAQVFKLQAVPSPPGELTLKVPDYDLLRPIGQGAYGQVWLARNMTGSWVALKIVHRAAFDHDRPFEREFEGIKRFEPISRSDPCQVAILHVGLGDGFFYYVMELADDVAVEAPKLNSKLGIRDPKSEMDQSLRTSAATYQPKTLKRLLNDRGALPAQECLAITLSLTRALAHLHGHGLVHRDVKPSNVIFVNGQAKLADIGLVTSVDATRSFVGTEGYLPPEGAGTPQADLFALGKVLYEMSTGCDRKEFPALPPDIATRPDRDAIAELNAIVVQACKLDPREHYANAEAMQADLALMQRGRSVRHAHQFDHLWCLARRLAGWLAAAAIALTLMMVLVNRVRQSSITPHAKKPSTNEVANSFYNQGDAYLDKLLGTNIQMAVYCFEQATNADPWCALAYARLADTYSWSTGEWNQNWKYFPKAREIALQALKLDASLAKPHSTLGNYYALMEWKWNDAEREHIIAIQIDPSVSSPHFFYSEFLRMVGQTDKALEEIKKAKALDLHSRTINARLPYYLADARHFEEAIMAADDASAAGLNLYEIKAECFCALTNYEAAINAELNGRLRDGDARDRLERELGDLKSAVKDEGPRAYWLRALERAKQENNFYAQGRACAQLGENKEAMVCVQRAFDEGDRWLTFHVMTDWMLDPVRSHRDFKKILKQMNLE